MYMYICAYCISFCICLWVMSSIANSKAQLLIGRRSSIQLHAHVRTNLHSQHSLELCWTARAKRYGPLRSPPAIPTDKTLLYHQACICICTYMYVYMYMSPWFFFHAHGLYIYMYIRTIVQEYTLHMHYTFTCIYVPLYKNTHFECLS